jgi:transposase InsO family protein
VLLSELEMERVGQRDYVTHGEAQRDITDYIMSFYNGIRLHSKLGYLSPAIPERKMAAIQPVPLPKIT